LDAVTDPAAGKIRGTLRDLAFAIGAATRQLPGRGSSRQWP